MNNLIEICKKNYSEGLGDTKLMWISVATLKIFNLEVMIQQDMAELKAAIQRKWNLGNPKADLSLQSVWR